MIPTYYSLTSEACSKLLQRISVNLPGFGNEKFSFETTLLRKLQESKTEIEIKTKIGSAFMKGGNNKGVKFAYPVAWRTPSKKNITGSVVISAEVTLGKINAEMLQSEKGSKIMFLDPFGNQQFHPWNRDRFELGYIQYSVQKGNVTKLFNIAGFSEENTAELIAVGNHHYVMGETTDKRKFVIQVLSEEIRIKHLVVNKTNHQNVFFYQFSLDTNSQQTTYTVTTQDVSRSGLDALFVFTIVLNHFTEDFLILVLRLLKSNFLSDQVHRSCLLIAEKFLFYFSLSVFLFLVIYVLTFILDFFCLCPHLVMHPSGTEHVLLHINSLCKIMACAGGCK